MTAQAELSVPKAAHAFSSRSVAAPKPRHTISGVIEI